jgi:hypothetical protein
VRGAVLPQDDIGSGAGLSLAQCLTRLIVRLEMRPQVGRKFMACRSTPGFPELRRQLEIMRPKTVRQFVRQYLIEGLELFAVHRCSGRSITGGGD